MALLHINDEDPTILFAWLERQDVCILWKFEKLSEQPPNKSFSRSIYKNKMVRF